MFSLLFVVLTYIVQQCFCCGTITGFLDLPRGSKIVRGLMDCWLSAHNTKETWVLRMKSKVGLVPSVLPCRSVLLPILMVTSWPHSSVLIGPQTMFSGSNRDKILEWSSFPFPHTHTLPQKAGRRVAV